MIARSFCLVVLGIVLSGCGVGEGTGSTPPWEDPPTPTATDVERPAAPYEPTVDGEVAYRVRMETTKGDVVIAVVPEWAPRGAERFKELVESGFYDDIRIFRVMPGRVVQFGMHGDPEVTSQWRERSIEDDPVQQSNQRGYVTFATSGRNARTTQVFVNLGSNSDLDTLPENFAPFGKVVEGMDVVDSFNDEYEGTPSDQQTQIAEGGNEFLDENFPNLDSIVKMSLIEAPQSEGQEDPDAPAKEPE